MYVPAYIYQQIEEKELERSIHIAKDHMYVRQFVKDRLILGFFNMNKQCIANKLLALSFDKRIAVRQ